MNRTTALLSSLFAGLLAAIGVCLIPPPSSSPAPDQSAPAPLVRPHIARDYPLQWDYDHIRGLIEDWHDQAPGWCEVSSYGTSSKGLPLTCVRLHHRDSQGTPVWLQACIHGNEPLSTAVALAWCARLLNETPEVLDTLDIVLIPSVCPDSFCQRRECDGIDPNRGYDSPHPIPPIAAVKDLFDKVKPKAAISAHTFSRLWMIPPGSTRTNTPDEAAYQDLFGRMGKLSGYKVIHGYEMYGREIHGSDMDFMHEYGATSCVVELGTARVGGQRIPTPAETKEELDRTWPAFCLWLKEAPTMRKSYQCCPLSLELR